MSPDDLVPLKQVVGALGVSRATLWRASKIVSGFPPPRIIAGRVFWKACELDRLDEALSRFAGRVAFERERRLIALRAERDCFKAQRRCRQAKPLEGQIDLFAWRDGGLE